MSSRHQVRRAGTRAVCQTSRAWVELGGKRLAVHDGQRGDGTGQDDVEPAQARALVGLGSGDGGGLDHDDPVELQALGDGRGNDVHLVVHVAVVAPEDTMLDSIALQGC